MSKAKYVGASLVAIWIFSAGCAGTGYVSTGYYDEPLVYPDPLFVPAPDVYVFEGVNHPHRHFAHEFSHRGYVSRHDFQHFESRRPIGRPPGATHGVRHGDFRGRHH
jgi:hypothetical protein